MRKISAADVCQVSCINPDRTKRAQKHIYAEDKLNLLSELFKTISDGTRIKILLALKGGELCVCDLAQTLKCSVSLVSHQLRILRNLRMVKYRNEGRIVYYSLFDKHVIDIITKAGSHIKE